MRLSRIPREFGVLFLFFSCFSRLLGARGNDGHGMRWGTIRNKGAALLLANCASCCRRCRIQTWALEEARRRLEVEGLLEDQQEDVGK
jgi:hypothetical protein